MEKKLPALARRFQQSERRLVPVSKKHSGNEFGQRKQQTQKINVKLGEKAKLLMTMIPKRQKMLCFRKKYSLSSGNVNRAAGGRTPPSEDKERNLNVPQEKPQSEPTTIVESKSVQEKVE